MVIGHERVQIGGAVGQAKLRVGNAGEIENPAVRQFTKLQLQK